MEWLPIETAPYQTEVWIKVGRGMAFRAILEAGVSMTEDEVECDQWSATVEGEHPPCWSGGSCWASNENEDRSLQPRAWMPLPSPPEAVS